MQIIFHFGDQQMPVQEEPLTPGLEALSSRLEGTGEGIGLLAGQALETAPEEDEALTRDFLLLEVHDWPEARTQMELCSVGTPMGKIALELPKVYVRKNKISLHAQIKSNNPVDDGTWATVEKGIQKVWEDLARSVFLDALTHPSHYNPWFVDHLVTALGADGLPVTAQDFSLRLYARADRGNWAAL